MLESLIFFLLFMLTSVVSLYAENKTIQLKYDGRYSAERKVSFFANLTERFAIGFLAIFIYLIL